MADPKETKPNLPNEITWKSYDKVPNSLIVKQIKEKKILDSPMPGKSKVEYNKESDFGGITQIKKLFSDEKEKFSSAANIFCQNILHYLATQKMKKMRKRKFIVLEFRKTEDDYINNLKVLQEVYCSCLKNFKPLGSKNYQTLFNGLESITNFNQLFLKGIDEEVFNKETKNYIHNAQLSRKILEFLSFLKMYKDYFNTYDTRLLTMKQLKSDQKVISKLNELDKDPRTNQLGLESYLILPVQRIPRYNLLLRDMLKVTEKEHPDYDNLIKSIEKLKITADELNNSIKDIENGLKVVELQSKFNNLPPKFAIHEPHRRLMFESDITLVSSGSLSFFPRKQERGVDHLHIFNDVVIFSSKTVDKNKKESFDFLYKMEISSIFQILFADSKDPDEHLAKLGRIEFCLPTADIRDECLMHIFNKKLSSPNKRSSVFFDMKNSLFRTLKQSPSLGGMQETSEEDFRLTDEECISYMKKNPTTMLKYCSKKKKSFLSVKNKPHERKFVLSSDEKQIMWGSPKKDISSSSINISSVKDILLGQVSDAFKENPKPSCEAMSFSLLYLKGKSKEGSKQGPLDYKTLDLICQTSTDFLIWTKGIKALKENKKSSNSLDSSIPNSPIKTNTTNFPTTNNNSNTNNTGTNTTTQNQPEKENEKVFNSDFKLDKVKPTVKDIFLSRGNDFIVPNELKVSERENLDKFKEQGDAFIWGRGESGAIGKENESDCKTPAIASELLWTNCNVDKAFCGNNRTYCLLKNGKVVMAGSNTFGELGSGDESGFPQKTFISLNFVQENSKSERSNMENSIKEGGCKSFNSKRIRIVHVALGDHHSLFLDENGHVWGCGSNEFFQLGNFENETNVLKNGKVCSLVLINLNNNEKDLKIQKLECGYNHSGALNENGDLLMWGKGTEGQLGSEKKENSKNPINITSSFKEKIVSISFGFCSSLALTEKGVVYCWGDGFNLKSNTSHIPSVVEGLDSIFINSISCGAHHFGAISRDGTCYMWGDNKFGQCGIVAKQQSSENKEFFMKPTKIGVVEDFNKIKLIDEKHPFRFKQLSLGGNHSVAIVEDPDSQFDKVFCWGAGSFGRLGIEDEKDRSIPVYLSFFEGREVRYVCAGVYQTSCICAHQIESIDDTEECMICSKNLSTVTRKDYCRNCGGVFCGQCIKNRIEILKFGFTQPVPVCVKCFEFLSPKINV